MTHTPDNRELHIPEHDAPEHDVPEPDGGEYDGREYHGREPEVRELADVPAIEVISRAAVMLMSAAAEKIGLSSPDPDISEHRDLDEARRLINALAGLLDGSKDFLGPHRAPMRDGLRSLQLAFREAGVIPDEPGQGPGERHTGLVK